uniref:holin family protein n=1 Tax=Yoonia sp. TaxID=2212373 RepID=UPI004047A69C|tara:strand:- start:576 stop:1079 length:504 start_codon:yes stop_codon:yes gene_type:complete
MGLIESIMAMIFGGGRNVVAETVEVFRENSEKGAVREAGQRGAALAQFAAEFGQTRTSGFDRFIDGINRLPRPLLALGTIALFVSAMVDPVWFSQRMAGIALVPEPLWWLMGAIVSFYFGARYQLKGQEFQRQTLQAVAAVAPPAASLGDFDNNAALQDWQAQYGRS